jgi:signal transduction histidine kinase
VKANPKGLWQRYVAVLKQLKQLKRVKRLKRLKQVKQLKQEILRRKDVERNLRANERYQAGLLERSHQMQGRLRHLSHQVLMAQEEERKEISRELHDKVAQVLTAINVHLALLKMEAAGNTQGLKKKISNAQRLLQKSVKIVHRFARELRPTLLDDIGIIPAFRVYVKDFTKHTRIPVHFDCVGSVEQVNPARRTALYRVAQEALGNVAQHAQASRVTMNLRKVRNAVRMTIKDNGKSFQVERVILGHKNRSLGLLGMRERIEMVGGNFKIDSVRGKGTTVQARVPLK